MRRTPLVARRMFLLSFTLVALGGLFWSRPAVAGTQGMLRDRLGNTICGGTCGPNQQCCPPDGTTEPIQ